MNVYFFSYIALVCEIFSHNMPLTGISKIYGKCFLDYIPLFVSGEGDFPVSYLIASAFLGAAIMFIFIRLYGKGQQHIKMLEEKRKKSEEAEVINKDRMLFYASMAHELRSPLSLITGPLSDLCSQKDVPAKQLQKLRLIRSGSERLLSIVNDIIDFQRHDRNTSILNVSRGDIGAYVNSIGLRFKSYNLNSNLKIRINIEPGLPTVYFDEKVISTVVRNLMSNALKYTSSGEILLSVREIKLFDRYAIEISVKDSGIGIPQEELESIFDKYYRLTDDERIKGNGIGLAMVKMMAKHHEGEVLVKSEKGHGAEFSFCIYVDNVYPDAEHVAKIVEYREFPETYGTSYEDAATSEFSKSEIPDERVKVVSDVGEMRNLPELNGVRVGQEGRFESVAQYREDSHKARRDTEFLNNFTDLIEGNMTKVDLDIKFIEINMNMSRSTIFRRLKSLTGLSIVDYIRMIRLRKSQEMLGEGVPVSETAYACGFNDASYFSTIFKREFGMSPRQYQRSLHQTS